MTRWIALAAAYLACITIHEFGHALAVWACGGHVKEFALFAWPPHVTPVGSFTDIQLSLISLAGAGLFFAVWFPFMLLAEEASEDNVLVFASSVCAMQEAAVWVLGALLSPSLFSTVDAAKFIAHSGASRTFIALLAASIGFLAWRIAAIRQPGSIRPSFWVYCLAWNLAVWR
jgi:hypothetical protein